jgi:hypothetical protein
MIRFRAGLISAALSSLSLAACGGGSAGGASMTTTSTTTTSTTTTSATSTTTEGTGGAGTGGSTGTGGTAPASTVTFTYAPAWAGVTAVDVVGGFGLSTDWDPKQPLVKLAADATGTWTGTVQLPAGQYPYLFQVTGDADGPAGLARYAIDPRLSAFVPCPMKSPSYDAKNANPCSQLTVPQGPADTLHPVTGKVLYGGQPSAGYLVEFERDEAMSHHYFANRIDSGADGTFSLMAAPGSYRVQILHPTLYTQSDTQRDPLTLKALRRAISASTAVRAPVALDPVEMQYLDYPSLAPTGTATLPTTFTFTVIAGAQKARAAVYGTANGTGKSIGDPWWTSATGTATTASFDGTFTTKQATETMVKAGESYFWGTWQLPAPSSASAVAWSGESMVFAIKWP